MRLSTVNRLLSIRHDTVSTNVSHATCHSCCALLPAAVKKLMKIIGKMTSCVLLSICTSRALEMAVVLLASSAPLRCKQHHDAQWRTRNTSAHLSQTHYQWPWLQRGPKTHDDSSDLTATPARSSELACGTHPRVRWRRLHGHTWRHG